MAPILLSEEQSKELVKKLETYGFESLMVRASIITEFSFKPLGLKVWVDSWPQFSTVVLISLLQNESNTKQICSIFTLDEEKLKEILMTPDLIIWKDVLFAAYPLKYKSILESLADHFGCSMRGPPFTFQLLALNKEKSEPRKIPGEVSVSTLTPDQAEFIHKNWEFGSSDGREEETAFIKILIQLYPTVCLSNPEGSPIAYAMGQTYGGMGMLFVEPDYRKRGLGKLVMYLLSEKYSNMGYPPFVSVATDNEISNKLHHGLGFEPTGCFINWFSIRKN